MSKITNILVTAIVTYKSNIYVSEIHKTQVRIEYTEFTYNNGLSLQLTLLVFMFRRTW